MARIGNPFMSIYVDDYGMHSQRATTDVIEERNCVKVTYTGTRGASFSLMFIKRPNPIGFHARMPGRVERGKHVDT